jgi:hypothetical protein
LQLRTVMIAGSYEFKVSPEKVISFNPPPYIRPL